MDERIQTANTQAVSQFTGRVVSALSDELIGELARRIVAGFGGDAPNLAPVTTAELRATVDDAIRKLEERLDKDRIAKLRGAQRSLRAATQAESPASLAGPAFALFSEVAEAPPEGFTGDVPNREVRGLALLGAASAQHLLGSNMRAVLDTLTEAADAAPLLVADVLGPALTSRILPETPSEISLDSGFAKASFSMNTEFLALAYYDRMDVHRVADGVTVGSVPLGDLGDRLYFDSLAWCGQFLVGIYRTTSGDRPYSGLLAWNVSREELQSYEARPRWGERTFGDPFEPLVIASLDGERCACANGRNSWLFDLRAMQSISTHRNTADVGSIGGRGKLVATAGPWSQATSVDALLSVVDFERALELTGAVLYVSSDSGIDVTRIALAEDLVVAALLQRKHDGQYATLYRWPWRQANVEEHPPEQGLEWWKVSSEAGRMAAGFCENGNRIMLNCADHLTRIFDCRNGSLVAELSTTGAATMSFDGSRVGMPDGSKFVLHSLLNNGGRP